MGTQRYYPFGLMWPASGNLYTDYTFTGQKSDANQLMFYQSRYYDPSLGRFAQPDSMVPNVYNPQSLNRYAYVLEQSGADTTDPSGALGPMRGRRLQGRLFPTKRCQEFNATEWDTEHVDDEQLIDQVISDAGIRLCGDTCEGSPFMTLSQKKVVLRSVYTMQHRLRVGMEHSLKLAGRRR